MRRFLPLLLALALLPALAATCNIPATQKSPSGPWVGEVTNDTDAVISDSLVRGEIADATGRVQSIAVPTCPTRLAPGEKASWEIFADGYGLIPPLTGVFRHESTPVDLGVLSAGLIARVDEINPDLNAAAVTITNRSRDTIGGISICASMRDASGALLEVGNTSVVPSQLAAGASTTAVLYFASMPAGVTLDLKPQGVKLCCGLVPLAPESFRVASIRNDDLNDVLDVVAEVDNNTDFDLVDFELSVNVKGDPFARLEYHEPGCYGAIPKGQRGPWERLVRLSPATDVRDEVELEVRIAARPSPYPLVTLRPQSVAHDETTGDAEAVIRNTTGSWLLVQGTCFNVRTSSGKLLATHVNSSSPLLAPGGTFTQGGQFAPYVDGTLEVISVAQVLPAEPTPVWAASD